MRKLTAWVGLALCLPLAAQRPPMSFEEALAKVAVYEPGDDQAPIAALDRSVGSASSSPEKAKEVEQAMLRALEGKSSVAGKQQICRELMLVGSSASAPALAKLLESAEMAEMALYALERIPGPAVNLALRSALPKTSGKVRISIVKNLGDRKDSGSVSALRGLIPGDDPQVAAAAALALGQIADGPAIAALAAARPKATGALRAELDEAYLRAAEQMAQKGNAKGAFAIYKELNAPSEAEITRIAAIGGLATLGGKDSVPLLSAAMKAGEPRIRAQAIRQLSAIPGSEVTAALIQTLPGMDTLGKVQVLTALADRGDKAALPVLLTALKDSAQPLRVAAASGLGKIGDASVVMILAETAVKGGTAEQAAAHDFSLSRSGGFPPERQLGPAAAVTEDIVARESLHRLRGADVDKAIVAGIATATPELKVELMAAAAARAISSATPRLLANASDSHLDIRRAAFRALRDTAGPSDVPGLINLLVKSQGADRSEAGKVLSSVLRRSDKTPIAPVMSAYQSAADAALKGSLLLVLGQAGREESLPVLRGSLKESLPEVRRGAILGLSEWPTSSPMPDLLAVAKNDSTQADQNLALEGYIKLIGLPSNRTPAETVRTLSEAMSLAKRAEEKKAVLSQVQRFNTPEALALAEAATKDPEVAADAQAVLAQMQRGRGGRGAARKQ